MRRKAALHRHALPPRVGYGAVLNSASKAEYRFDRTNSLEAR